MKTEKDLIELKNECFESIKKIREARVGDAKENKSKENKESKRIEFLNDCIALLEFGYSEEKLIEWRDSIESKIEKIDNGKPKMTNQDTYDTHKKKVQAHFKAYDVSKLKQQVANINFLLF